MKQQFEEMQVPSGYKLVRTEMEKGVLFTYELAFKKGDEVYTFSNDGLIKTILLDIQDDIAYVFDLSNDISTRKLSDIFATGSDLMNDGLKIEDITQLYNPTRKDPYFEVMFINYNITE